MQAVAHEKSVAAVNRRERRCVLPFMAIFSTLRMSLRRPRKLADPTDLYAHRVRLLDGTELDLEGLRGRPP
jgi:hypothetical protein